MAVTFRVQSHMTDPSYTDGWRGRRVRIENRMVARLTSRAKVKTRFLADPDPMIIGSVVRGHQLMAGSFHFAGHLVQAPGRSVWTILPPDDGFAAQLQGFDWLDDLAAVGDAEAQHMARSWTLDWITRFGAGSGPGWTPLLAGRRLLRWINHGSMLVHEQLPEQVSGFLTSLGRQTQFVARRSHAAPPGLPRVEALTALIVAGLALEGMQAHVAPAVEDLAAHMATEVAADGSIASRNPETLLDMFALLALAGQALGQAGIFAGPAHLAAIERMAPVLRGLRHVDGRLARFHGGGPGPEGRLDQALAASGVRTLPGLGPKMGFARLSSGRTSVIVDAAAPPRGSLTAHASTLAIEVSSARRPIIVNCGSGAEFGADWLRAGRETASHSTLVLAGQSSCRFADGRGGEVLAAVPQSVKLQQAFGPSGHSLVAGHDGYGPAFGLTHVRRLNLSAEGRALVGEDTLGANTDGDRKRFSRMLNRSKSNGLDFALRFHLHPDVAAQENRANGMIVLTLGSGEVWHFRQHGGAVLSLEESVYLDRLRLKPRLSKQVVLAGKVIDYASQVSWTLAKARETPQGLRDLEPAGEPGQEGTG